MQPIAWFRRWREQLQLADWREQRYQEWATNPPAIVQRLRLLRAQRFQGAAA